MSAIFKGTYRNRCIYWHPGEGYGDETRAFCGSMAEARAKVDAWIAQELANRSPEDLYWDTLDHAERQRWRRLCQTTELSASELAYTNRSLPR